jgi:2-amino-4-hydroxy-6-hydroxymethyldihydropteridine diphosphokinase
MNTIILSIGSNINKEYNIFQCLELLKSSYGKIIKSSIYETFKVNNDNSIEINNNENNFWNLIIKINTSETYPIFYKKIKNIENQLGRIRKKNDKAYDRTIDIDIILFNQEVIYQNNEIKVPHKELGNCFYVDIPLLDLDPFIVHPLLNKTIQEIVNKEYLEKSNNFIKKIN